MFHRTRKVYRSFKVTSVFGSQSEVSETALFVTLIYCCKLFTHHISGMVETSLRSYRNLYPNQTMVSGLMLLD